MNTFTKFLNTSIIMCSLQTGATDVVLTAEDGMALKADYFKSKSDSNRAVLMLHQCNYNRTMYDDIGQQFALQGIHALSLDFRGFGESVSKEFDIEKVQALPQAERRAAWRVMSANWSSDVQLAYEFLKNKMNKDGMIGVIGASCGGGQAITLAENNPISVIGFFSSAQNDNNLKRYESLLADKPTLIIAAEKDGRTFTSAQKLFSVAKHPNTQLLSYKGAEHGYPLLVLDTHLSSKIADWFNAQLGG